MDLWQLKVFVSVVDNKSFSRAGDAIFLSQPTVSSHIKELESHLGCRLIDRLGREALPTKAGSLLYTYARKLITLKAETESAMSNFLGNACGDLTFGGSSIPATYIIPGIIGSFSREYPSISLSIITGDSSEIKTAILKGDLEAGMVGAKVDNPYLHQEKFIEDEMKLIVPSSHPWAKSKFSEIGLDTLQDEPFLGREKGSGTWDSISKAFTCAGLSSDTLNVRTRLDTNASVIQGILNNAGVSIVSTLAVQDYLKMGKLKAFSVKGVNLKRYFYLITHKKRTLSPLVKLFLKFLKNTHGGSPPQSKL